MSPSQREVRIAQVVAGRKRVRLGGRIVVLATPDRDGRLFAAEIHEYILEQAALRGIPTAAEAELILIERGLLSVENQTRLEKLPDDIDAAKLAIWENWGRGDSEDEARRRLARLRSERDTLTTRRDALTQITRESAASGARARMLAGCSIHLEGRPHWSNPWSDWEQPDHLVDEAVAALVNGRLGEADLRELARTDPWRGTWATAERCGRGVWDAAACDLSDEQRDLSLWSAHYESIRNCPSPPPDGVLEDDDALDGWLVARRKEREASNARGLMDQVRSKKIREADEVFLVVKNPIEAARVELLNDGAAAFAKARKMNHLKKHGTVRELDMPDIAERLHAEVMAKTIGGRGN
jgi:hypothetical protein